MVYPYSILLFLKINSFIHSFLAALGLRFCARAFSSCGEWEPLFIAVCGPLTVIASLAAEHRLQMLRLSSCGSRAQLLRGMWDLPRPGLEPMSPALAGRFSITGRPGKPQIFFFKLWIFFMSIVIFRAPFTFTRKKKNALKLCQQCWSQTFQK